ncbi:holin family protein [Algicella marina]|uniref:Methionine synthase I n=1 Tax=Algicella marina TaxID=2683284 RepID=A0A6P1SYN7_9RHOB|nr:holin family protein [Algicella marina]QHQ34483.1 methionine synthase I [Algicella marina]
MGLMNWLGIGRTVANVAEVFVENRTARAAHEHVEHVASLNALSAEFARPRGGWFDQLIDGLNRLPRPLLAGGTMGLFIYAMKDPVSFGARMQGLALMPEPMWWLLGAIVSFYFGARELHHFRGRKAAEPEQVAEVMRRVREVEALSEAGAPEESSGNAAVAAWRVEQG